DFLVTNSTRYWDQAKHNALIIMHTREIIVQKFAEVNSPFTFAQVVNDRKVSCDFIEWALIKIDRRLENFVSQNNERNFAFNSSKPQTERVQTDLVRRVALIGLCKPAEIDLIEGTAPHDRLIGFHYNLFSVLKVSRMLNNDEIKSDELAKSCSLMDGLTANCDLMNKVVDQQFELFPRDVELMIGNAKCTGNICSKVDISTLQNSKEKEKQLIHNIQTELNCMQERHAHEQDSNQQTLNKLAQVTKELMLQLERFYKIYDNEIEPWVRKDQKKVVNGLSLRVHEANLKLDSLRQRLKDFEIIHTSYEDIISHLPSTIKPQTADNHISVSSAKSNMITINNWGEAGLEAIERLHNVEKVLRDSI
ncbi:3963_t:CDS:2, partial [Racocetra persica]